MSNIVNVGIQQSGIDCVTPEKAPKEEMEKIKLFMSEEEADFVSSCYKEDKYKDKEILVLKDNLSEKDSDSLAKTLEKPMLIVYMMEKSQNGEIDEDSVSGELDMSEFNRIMEQGVKDMTPENQGEFFYLTREKDSEPYLFQLLPLFSESTRSEITDLMNKQLEGYEKLVTTP